MLKKKIFISMLVASMVMPLSSCGSQEQLSKVDGNESIKVESSKETVAQNQNANSTKENYKKEKVEITKEEAFKIAVKASKEYFDFKADKKKFNPDKITDMNTYWIVPISSNKGDLLVSVALESKQVFAITGSSSAWNKLKEEYKREKGIKDDKIDDKKLWEYKYSKEPVSEEESKKIAEKFIKSSPLKNKKLKYNESKYEFKFDSPEKEYYVFSYEEEGKESKEIFIKVDTFLREVYEVLM
ncbi:hypothetical protein OW763_01705 [Clostridium aestuarii]|uniref:Lipoprotein n=1 Tax=Clostridium aestuarii TaxID=338193 RepID=A0ABT4CZ38_9CLOT|nr:hypothetical protein [Clostridium aestuarii]MCY6483068.1 hypothetical protein [Clostridium aestuarii]